MSHACQAKAARRKTRNGYRHVALLGRPIFSRMSLEKSKARLAAKIATERRIQQGRKK